MEKNKGDVLIISGISGSGKSTLSESLRRHLIEKKRNVAVLDGDFLRNEFEGDLKYSSADRLMVSKILAFSAKILSSQGVDVILATMLSQPGAREFLKRRVNFTEIHLNAKFEDCKRNDVKNVYQRNLSKQKPQIVGHDLIFSSPNNPDFIIETHIESPEQSIEKIIRFLSANNLFGLSGLGDNS